MRKLRIFDLYFIYPIIEIFYLFVQLFFVLLIVTIGFSQHTAREIAEKADAAQRGFKDEVVESKMYLISAHGDTVIRELKNYTLERDDKMDYSIVQFLNPPDVRGTGLLTYQNRI